MKKLLLAMLLACAPAFAQSSVNLNMGFNQIYNNATIPTGTSLAAINLIFPSAAKSFQIIENARSSTPVQTINVTVTPSSLNLFGAPSVSGVSALSCAVNFNGTGITFSQLNAFSALGGSNAPAYTDCPVPETLATLFTIAAGTAPNGSFDIFINVTANNFSACSTTTGANYVVPCTQNILAGVTFSGAPNLIGVNSGVIATVTANNPSTTNTNSRGAGMGGEEDAGGIARWIGMRQMATYTHVTGTAATAVRASAPAWLHTVTINTGVAGTFTIFDLATASCTGTPATNQVAIITMTATTLVTLHYDDVFTNGICVQSSVTGEDVTVGTD